MPMKMISTLAVCLIACATGLHAAETSPGTSAKWNVRDHIPLREFIIQCHRGAGELKPENTLEAFQLGWNWGTIPECDMQTTRDGVIVTFHDGNFKRVVKDASPELQKKGVK